MKNRKQITKRKVNFFWNLKKKFVKFNIPQRKPEEWRDLKKLSNHIYKEKNTLIKAYLRDDSRYQILNSNLDINYYQASQNILHYFVGTKGKGIQSQIPRASLVRMIKPINKSTIFFEKLLPLMNVDFVKNGDLTVRPFPFKYLQEWIKTQI